MSAAVWEFTAGEQDLLGLKPGDRLGPGIVGEPCDERIETITITLHRSELIPGGNGARLAFSDDFPDKQFLFIPEPAVAPPTQ